MVTREMIIYGWVAPRQCSRFSKVFSFQQHTTRAIKKFEKNADQSSICTHTNPHLFLLLQSRLSTSFVFRFGTTITFICATLVFLLRLLALLCLRLCLAWLRGFLRHVEVVGRIPTAVVVVSVIFIHGPGASFS